MKANAETMQIMPIMIKVRLHDDKKYGNMELRRQPNVDNNQMEIKMKIELNITKYIPGRSRKQIINEFLSDIKVNEKVDNK